MSDTVLDPISSLPIGPEVPAHAAPLPERRVIAGRFIRLEPLDPDRHGTSLWQETHGIGAAARWQYLFDEPFADEKSFHDFLARKAACTDPLFYAIIDQSAGRAVGFESLMRIDPTHRCIEVGNILYGKSLQRTPGATEAQYLLIGTFLRTWATADTNGSATRSTSRRVGRLFASGLLSKVFSGST